MSLSLALAWGEPPATPPDNAAIRDYLSANGLAMLVFGVLPEPLMGLCLAAIQASL